MKKQLIFDGIIALVCWCIGLVLTYTDETITPRTLLGILLFTIGSTFFYLIFKRIEKSDETY